MRTGTLLYLQSCFYPNLFLATILEHFETIDSRRTGLVDVVVFRSHPAISNSIVQKAGHYRLTKYLGMCSDVPMSADYSRLPPLLNRYTFPRTPQHFFGLQSPRKWLGRRRVAIMGEKMEANSTRGFPTVVTASVCRAFELSCCKRRVKRKDF